MDKTQLKFKTKRIKNKKKKSCKVRVINTKWVFL